jgi:2-polyprenyl-6-methoxyphenol hydroxylase-like FAD-dependent oxidoreductase
MTEQNIVIVGAGIGGLTTALSLLRRGIDVDVYDQACDIREVGAGVQISANSTRILYELGLQNEVSQLGTLAAGKEIRLWNTGEKWKLFDLGEASIERYGFPYVFFHRADLHRILLDAIRKVKPDAIHLAMCCTGLRQLGDETLLEFVSGDTLSASIVVGADGVHSVVRKALFGADNPEFTGLIAWRGLIPRERVPATVTLEVGTNWIGPGAHIVHYPLRRGELLNFVAVAPRSEWQAESWSLQGDPDELLRDFRGWHPDVQRMIQGIEIPYKWGLILRSPSTRWSAGRITLVGDACHPTLPFLAQGAVMAIEDGFILARCLEQYGSDYATAFSSYEAARQERTRKVVLGSAENAKRFHDNRLADDSTAQAYLNREWQEDRVRDRYEWLFAYNACCAPI